MDQLPRLGKRELICLLLFTCNYVVSVWKGLLFLWVLGMGYVFLLWHSLSLPYNYFSNHLSLAEEQALLREILEETDIDSDDDLEETGDCAYCHRKIEKCVELKKCSLCRITHYCSVNCQREDWEFDRLACSVIVERAKTITTWPVAYRRSSVHSI